MRQPYAYVANESHLRDLKWTIILTSFICGLLLMSRSPLNFGFLTTLRGKGYHSFLETFVPSI